MKIRETVKAIQNDMTAWRHELHQNPQTAFEETYASQFVQKKLDEFGIPYKTGYGSTGIVATIQGRSNKSGKTIGLRSDMDALDVSEDTGKPWVSHNEGKMHACGHDGHMTMLLGAGKVLKDNPNFDGTIHLIFQPAEETLEGARAMLKDGLFNDFPCDEIYGMHNWPWIPKGQFGMCDGVLMAAVSNLEITIVGKAGHSGIIHDAIDPVIIGCQIITTLQTLVSQQTNPNDPVIIYFPVFETGVQEMGVIPEMVTLKGVIRTFNSGLRSHLEQRVRDMANSIATAHGGTAAVKVTCDSDAVYNHEKPTANALSAATKIVGDGCIDTNYTPVMAGEDFGSFVSQIPGHFIFLGQQEKDQPNHSSGYSLHSPYYDFNDDVLPIGTEYWVSLTETVLPLKSD